MRLTTVILIATLMQVSAATFGQRINFNQPNASLKSVLQEIRRQSGFDLYYDGKLISENQKVDVILKDATLSEALQKTLRGLHLSYEIEGTSISIKKKPDPSFLEEVISAFQDITVRGKIVDAEGKPIVGATVKLQGSRQSVQSGAEGYFSLPNVSENALVDISFIGYKTKTISATRNAGIIILELINNDLNEIVINTGYQSIKKEKMTGATVTVTASDLEKRYTPNILDNLEGRVPGLVNYRGTATIRGVGTFSTNTGSRSPLYVVDGLPIDGSIANINPYDVESITVLKDAAAAAIYGIRATNGVIVVVTKKAKGGRTSIDFGTDLTLTNKLDYSGYQYLSPADQVDLESKAAEYSFVTAPGALANRNNFANTTINNGNPVTPVTYDVYQFSMGNITRAQLDARLATYRQNDFREQYRDNVLLNQLLQQYNLSIRTDSQKFNSSLVLNYKKDNSGIINAYNKQLNISYKGTYKVAEWMDVSFGVNTILGSIKASNSSFATSGINVSPYLNLIDANGNPVQYTTTDYNAYATQISTTPQLQSMGFNHLEELTKDLKRTTQNFGRYYVNAKAKILPGLSFSPQFQYENNNTSVRAYAEGDSYIMRYLRNVYTTRSGTAPNFTYTYAVPDGGKLATSTETMNAWTARGQFDYNKQINKHEISVIAGSEFRNALTKGSNGLLLGYDDQLQSHSTGNVNFGTLSNTTTTSFFKPSFNTSNLYTTYIANQIGVIPEVWSRSNSLYGNATYTYDNKYNVFGSYRKDYTNVFGLDVRYRSKPLMSAGLGWNIHNETFMSNYSWVNFLKARATYGLTGNLPPGLSSRRVANSALPVNAATLLPVSVITFAANPLLRWEKTATINFGLDFTLFDRLSGTFDWYRKKGTDIYAATRIDPSEGFTSQILNNGDVLNNGLELSLNYKWLRPSSKDGLSWSSQLVVTKNNNKVTYIDQIANTPQLLTTGGMKIDYPVNALFSYQYKGISSTGQAQWVKADGSLSNTTLTTNDLNAIVYSGGTDPKQNISLINEFGYKGLSLNILAVYYGGHFQRALQPTLVNPSTYGTMSSYALNAWTPGNTNTLIPGYGQYAPSTAVPLNQLTYADSFVVASDFIKIRSIILSYQIPKNAVKKLGINNLGLRFQVNNPKAIWVKNKVGIDPETGLAPILTSYVFGLNFNL